MPPDLKSGRAGQPDLVDSALAQGPETGRTPFVEIRPLHRLGLVALVVLMNILLPSAQLLLGERHAPLAGYRLVADAAQQLLLLFPLLLLRRRIGWLSPLVFPLAWGLAKSLPKNFNLLIGFLSFAAVGEPTLYHPALVGWSQQEIALAILTESLLSSLAVMVYYLGFFLGPRIATPRLRSGAMRHAEVKLFLVCIIATAVCIAYIAAHGGIRGFMTSWGGGRFQATEFDGPVQVIIRSITVAVFVWYVVRPGAFRNPFFLMSLAAVPPITFLSSGSRSGALYLIVLLVMIWMLRHRALPVGRILGVSLAGLLLYGSLGVVRWSVWGGNDVDWSVVTRLDWRAAVQHGISEAEDRRAADGALGVIGRVGKGEPLLYGESYLAGLFFVPRAVWPGKPRGAGAIYVARIYGLGERSYGIPIGPVAEAYWNLHVPGVIIVFFLFGIFHRWLARLLERDPREPQVWAIYAPTLLLFSPTTDAFVQYSHFMVSMLVLLWFVGTLRVRRPGFGHAGVTELGTAPGALSMATTRVDA